MPRRLASRCTAAKARAMLVCSYSIRFIETWTNPPDCNSKPSAFAKVSRNHEFIPHALAGVVGERDALVKRDAAHGNKRQIVGGTDARMLSGVRSQID